MNSSWQTIKTAPKDGTRLLSATFSTNFGYWQFEVIHWINRGSDNHSCWSGRGSPSHWMPLPQPPESRAP